MRQRLGVARCLLADPELLILDEPMNGLDPGGILEFRTMIGELTGEGRTVFLSSHLLDEVEKTCDAAAVIDRGRIIAQGPISELVADEHAELDVGCDDPHAALDLLDGHPAVAAAYPTPDGIRITLGRHRRRRLDQRPAGDRRRVGVAPGAGARVAGAALPGNDVSSRRSVMTLTVARQMIGAEILKVRRNRQRDGVRPAAHRRRGGAHVRLHRHRARLQPGPERTCRWHAGVRPWGPRPRRVLRDARPRC